MVNATGAIGALACELGLDWRAVRGIGVMARAVGLVGHLLEESREPMAEAIWHQVEEAGDAAHPQDMNLGARKSSRAARRGAPALQPVRLRVLAEDRRAARLPRSLRRGADQGGLDVGADPRGIRRLRPVAHRSDGDHGGSDALGRQRRLLPRPDVQHEHPAAPRLAAAEEEVPAEDRHRRAAPAVDGRHRARRGHRHHQDQDRGGEERRPLRGERPEGVDLAAAALGADDPARAHHSAFRR